MVCVQHIIIWGLLGGGALLAWATGLDTVLAHALYEPNHLGWAWTLRQYGTWPGTALASVALIAMLVPSVARARPLFYRTAVVVALSAILGAGLLNQVIVKDLADRPRPRETVLVDVATVPDGFKGHSMPSGHAAMGFVLAAPYFALRRRRPRQAKVWLVAGCSAGLLLGVARMVVGAHFLSDVLVAGAIGLSTAATVDGLMETLVGRLDMMKRFAGRFALLAAGTGLATAAAFIVFNPITMVWEMPLSSDFKRFDLPCPVEAHPATGLVTPRLRVSLNGYGAPASALGVTMDDGVVRLKTSGGIYHSLRCTAVMETVGE